MCDVLVWASSKLCLGWVFIFVALFPKRCGQVRIIQSHINGVDRRSRVAFSWPRALSLTRLEQRRTPGKVWNRPA